MDLVFDVLIVGTGLAGIYSALNLDKNLKVLLITKTKVNECNSNLAQGGISVARDSDDIEIFIKDTLNAGKDENNLIALRILANESSFNINKLVEFGIEFDKNEKGFEYTIEGAHSVNRIIHCKDSTGKEVINALYKEIKKRKNITIFEDTQLIDLITDNNICYGGAVLKNGTAYNIFSKVTILATGGIGGLFKSSTNYRSITGDGIAIALKNNVKIKDLGYIQIHPTSLYENKLRGRRMLISEAVRGEGGKLLNLKGERFVDELSARDVVTKAIVNEQFETKSAYVYLDVSFKSNEYIKNRFPAIFKECLKIGINITEKPIPVTPAQHYLMGGIEVDVYSRTSMTNLFACGEVSCTGVHGRNRLASNSLLEALVFSKRAADLINNDIENIELKKFYKQNSIKSLTAIEKLNKRIILDSLKSVREDFVNELVEC
ncbi:L-aspartate oxidase [Tissierella creatinophila]|uniref:L-aspartate oxidase n=1 Tax=Tissierella creatinophila DSM 6911 TaxID=1123403 RepID=A0A1U7M2V2_TISCR|nr:L-aspartate oxidase [Tissierella creatinophila]OLS01644.1 L-aspartate oxidase [Tissierella creatinophila DSM 6911]